MGLAASQARFLAITARKADCEFRSMQIAQDKLSVTRKLSDVTQQYQNALNQKKLVWDYDGTGQNAYNLSYGVLMNPTALNGYTPYLITDRTGAVVLNGPLASAAAVISPDGTPTSSTESGYNSFIQKLASVGVITSATSNNILAGNGTIEYNPNAGYGATPMSKDPSIANNLAAFIYKTSRADYKLNQPTSSFTSSRQDDKACMTSNGSDMSTDEISKLTIGDILSNNVILSFQCSNNDNPDQMITDFINNYLTAEGGYWTQIYNELEAMLGVDVYAKNALSTAKTMIESTFINKDMVRQTKAGAKTATAVTKSREEANTYNQICYSKGTHDKAGSFISINLTNLVSSFLTYFEMCYNGFNTNYTVQTNVADSYYVTDDPNYHFVTSNDDCPSDDLILADYYMQLYNNICHNGWTTNSDIDDENYLENALKNGTYFITSLNDDGYFYQGRYNEVDCVVEVEDSDAIAAAEAEFNAEKTKLTYKEEKLDLEMKNLDTEISSLTTEYDAVKSLISKNVEKVFAMFQ